MNKEKPPLLSKAEIIDNLTMDMPDAKNKHPAEQTMYYARAIAEAQRLADIKWYEAQSNK